MKNLTIALIALLSFSFTACTPDEELLEVQQEVIDSNDYTIVVEIVPDWDWFMDTTHLYGMVNENNNMTETTQMLSMSGFASVYKDSLVEFANPILWKSSLHTFGDTITENFQVGDGDIVVDGMIVFHTNNIDSLNGEFIYQTRPCKYNFIIRIYEGYVPVTKPALEVFSFLGSGAYTPYSNDYVYQFNPDLFDDTPMIDLIKLPILNSNSTDNEAKVVFEYSNNQISITSIGNGWNGEILPLDTLSYVQSF